MNLKSPLKILFFLFSLLIFISCQTPQVNAPDISRAISNSDKINLESDQSILTFIENGGWCWFQDERVLMQGDRLIIGAISGKGAGDVKVATYDMAKGEHLAVSVLRSDFERDDHNAPVFCELPDGRILSCYQEHYENADPHHYFRLSKSNDTTQWDEEYSYFHGKGNWLTYSNLYYLEDEKRLYNFFRDGNVYSPHFIWSDDFGKNWNKKRVKFIEDGNIRRSQRPYARYCSNGKDAIYFSFTEGHPRVCDNSIYYAEYREGNFYHVDGQLIKNLKKKGPLKPQEADLIYQGTNRNNRSWTSSIRMDSQGNPVVGFTVYRSDDDHRYGYAVWDGSQWVVHEIAYGGSCFYTQENDYTGLITIDPVDTNIVYISTNVDPTTGSKVGTGHFEIYKGKTADNGVSWSWSAITSNSDEDNIRPVAPPSNGKNRALLWLQGEFTFDFQNYDFDVVGYLF